MSVQTQNPHDANIMQRVTEHLNTTMEALTHNVVHDQLALKNNLDRMNHETQDLNSLVHAAGAQQSQLRKKIEKLMKTFATLKTQVQSQSAQIEKQADNMAMISKQKVERTKQDFIKQVSDVPIGFTATSVTTQVYPDNAIIQFRRVIYGGPQYDPVSSTYTVGTAGKYFFQVILYFNFDANRVFDRVGLYKNSLLLASAVSGSYSGVNPRFGLAGAVTNCQVGDVIHVRSETVNIIVYGDSENGFSTFSGLYISPLL